MSKSLGNFIGSRASKEISKVMSLPTGSSSVIPARDDAASECDALARFAARGANPMASRRRPLTDRRMYHGQTAADFAQDEFEKHFSRRELPRNCRRSRWTRCIRARDLMMSAFPGQYTGSRAGTSSARARSTWEEKRVADVAQDSPRRGPARSELIARWAENRDASWRKP